MTIKTICRCAFVCVAVAAACSCPAASNQPASSLVECPCLLCRAKKRVNAPDWLKLGADLRLRLEYDEARRLDKEATGHDRFWQRYRARVCAEVTPWKPLSFNIRAVTEPRYFCRPDLPEQLVRHEVVFDKLNVTWRNFLGWPVRVVAGRQDICLGSGWLVGEGTPRDGSRTFFSDAIRLTAELKDLKTTVDAIFIDNHANSSYYVHPLNDRDLDLVEQDERGAILYVSNTSLPGRKIEGYFIYKRDHDRAVPAGVEGETYTFGARLEGKLGEKWRYDTEVAPQFGHKNGHDFGAFAGRAWLSYHCGDPHKNVVGAGYEYLSGSHDPNRNFDRLWGRYNQWNTVYTGRIDAIDGRAFDSSNLHRASFNWCCKPAKPLTFETGYHLLFADANPSGAAALGVSRSAKFRGQLLRGLVKHKWNEHLEHRVYAGFFFPGDYYTDALNDVAVFLRYQIMLTW